MSDSGTVAKRPVIHLGDKAVELNRGVKVRADKPRVDIVIAFDTTGSMSSKRGPLASCMSEFVGTLDAHQLDWRVSVLPFGDLEVGDRIEGQWPFVKTTDEAVQQLRGMPSFSGGANSGESSIEAMEAALSKPWRARALKVVILLTDDFALHARTAPQVTSRLVQSDTLCFAAALDTAYYREWATRTGGTWTTISGSYDTSAIQNLFKKLVRDVATTAATVHRVALGSPQKYRELTGGTGSRS